MSKRLPISRKSLHSLSLDQLLELKAVIRQLIQAAKEAEKRRRRLKRGSEGEGRDNRTYRLVSIRCGKENCKCAQGSGHGPYWYAFWSEQGKTKSKYIGKKRPPKRSKQQDRDKEKRRRPR